MFSAASSALLEIPRSELPILLNPHAKLPLLSFGNRIGLSFLSSPPASSACSSALPSTEPSTSERRSSWNLWHLRIEFLRIKLSLPNTKRGKTSKTKGHLTHQIPPLQQLPLQQNRRERLRGAEERKDFGKRKVSLSYNLESSLQNSPPKRNTPEEERKEMRGSPRLAAVARFETKPGDFVDVAGATSVPSAIFFCFLLFLFVYSCKAFLIIYHIID